MAVRGGGHIPGHGRAAGQAKADKRGRAGQIGQGNGQPAAHVAAVDMHLPQGHGSALAGQGGLVHVHDPVGGQQAFGVEIQVLAGQGGAVGAGQTGELALGGQGRAREAVRDRADDLGRGLDVAVGQMHGAGPKAPGRGVGAKRRPGERAGDGKLRPEPAAQGRGRQARGVADVDDAARRQGVGVRVHGPGQGNAAEGSRDFERGKLQGGIGQPGPAGQDQPGAWAKKIVEKGRQQARGGPQAEIQGKGGPGVLGQGDAQPEVGHEEIGRAKAGGQAAFPGAQRAVAQGFQGKGRAVVAGQGRGDKAPGRVGEARLHGQSPVGVVERRAHGQRQRRLPVQALGGQGQGGRALARLGQPAGQADDGGLAGQFLVEDKARNGQPVQQDGRQPGKAGRPVEGDRGAVGLGDVRSAAQAHHVGGDLVDDHPAGQQGGRGPGKDGVADDEPRPLGVGQGEAADLEGKGQRARDVFDAGGKAAAGGDGALGHPGRAVKPPGRQQRQPQGEDRAGRQTQKHAQPAWPTPPRPRGLPPILIYVIPHNLAPPVTPLGGPGASGPRPPEASSKIKMTARCCNRTGRCRRCPGGGPAAWPRPRAPARPGCRPEGPGPRRA